jgi:meiotic recombination protein REC8, fungi type
MLPDDPNFLPDFDLMPIDLNQLNFDVTTAAGESQHSAFSPHNSQTTIQGINAPGRSSSLIGGPVGGIGGSFGVRGDFGAGRAANAGPFLLEDDLGMQVDDAGNIDFLDVAASRQLPGPTGRVDRTDPRSASHPLHGGGAPGSALVSTLCF